LIGARKLRKIWSQSSYPESWRKQQQARKNATIQEVLHEDASAHYCSWPTEPLASDPSKLQESNQRSESSAARIGEGAQKIPIISKDFPLLNCTAVIISGLRDFLKFQQENPFSPSSQARKAASCRGNLKVGPRRGPKRHFKKMARPTRYYASALIVLL